MADNDIPEIDIKTRQQQGKAHVEVDVPMPQKPQEEKGGKEEEKPEKKEEDNGFTIAGYKPSEILKAPLQPPDEKEVGERSSQSE